MFEAESFLVGAQQRGWTFDRRIVLINKVALYELNGQAGFAHAAASYNHEFVFAEELHR